jgi:transcriptional regulator with XRE-family HTH domain
MKTAERLRARELRAEHGLSIREIASLLDVSRGTVSVWVRDVQLTPAQRRALAARNPALNPRFNGSKTRARRALAARLEYQAEGRALAGRRDPEFAAGCMLFWAEGSRERNAVKFTNSDPEMMAFFLRFLRRHFGVTNDMVAVWCNLFADHSASREEIEQFWLDTLQLPRSSLGKSTVNVYSKYSNRLRKNRLPYGTCRIAVYRTRIVQALYGAIQELAGFDRPHWATMPRPRTRVRAAVG